MKCPLFMAVWGQHSANVVMNNPDCLEKDCAWWETEGESCAVLLLGIRLGTVCEAIYEIIDKMPHEE